MSSPTIRDVLKSLMPSGPVWVTKPLSGLDQLYDAISDTKQTVKTWLENLAHARDPYRTPFVSDLEREYGVRPVSTLTEDERRELLAGIVYAKPGMGSDDLQARLHAAGFTDLYVYQNDPVENPDLYLGGEWSCVCGNDDSVCGNDLAYCGLRGEGGYLLVNGPTYIPPGTGTLAEYTVPATSEKWHLIFFVGGEKAAPTVGFFIILDGDMEDTTTAEWTAGNGAILTKDAVDPYQGLRSLNVAGSDDYTKQDVGLDVPDPNCFDAYRISDIGNTWFYSTKFATRTPLKNGISALTNPVLSAGSNDTSAEAVEFNGVDEGARGDNNQILDDQGAVVMWAKINDPNRASSFRLRPNASGYGQLPQDITINSITKSPVTRIVASDFTLPTWFAEIGEDFGRQGSTDVGFDELAPGLGENRVKFNNNDYYRVSDSSFADIGTDDFVMEILYQHEPGTYTVFSKYDTSINRIEFVSSTLRLRCIVQGASGSAIVETLPMTQGKWYLIHFFMDRSGSGIAYVNGVQYTAISISSMATDNLGDGSRLTVGARSNGGIPTSASVSYVSLWQGASWLDSHLQQAVVDERCARCFGLYPEVAGTATPTILARLSEATLEKFIDDESGSGDEGTALIPVGDNWLRTSQRAHVESELTIKDSGYVCEAGTTNDALYSEDFSNAVWVKSGASITSAAETRLGDRDFGAIVADTSTGKHYVEQATTLGADDVCVSVWFASGQKEYLRIEYVEDPTQWVMFRVAGETTITDIGSGMASPSDDAEWESYGNGICRVQCRFVCLASPTFRIMPSDGGSDGDESYTGDGSSEEVYIYGAQFEKGKRGALSYVPTTGSSASTLPDQLEFSTTNNMSGLSENNFVSMRTYAHETNGQSTAYMFSLDDGTTSERSQLSTIAASNAPRMIVVNGGATQASMTAAGSALGASYFQDFQFVLFTDRFRFYKNGTVDATTDNSGTPPPSTALDSINIGADQAASGQFSGMISIFDISDSGIERPRGIFAINDDSGPGMFVGYEPTSTFLSLDEADMSLYYGTDGTGITQDEGKLRYSNGEVTGWNLIALTWDGATTRLKINTREASNVADTTVMSAQNYLTMLLGWSPTEGYDSTDATTEYATVRGAVSIADVRVYDAVPDNDWWDELTDRGVPPYDRALVHRILRNPSLRTVPAPPRVTFDDQVSGLAFEKFVITAPDQGGTELGIGILSTTAKPVYGDSSTASTFLSATDHSFNGWIRVDATNADQMVWGSGVENSTTWQALHYDYVSKTLRYSCVIGATLRTVEAAVVDGRLYHVAVARSTSGGNTTISIYIDGNLIETATYAGAPVVTATTLYLLNTGGSPDMQFTGAVVDMRFYDDAQTLAEIQAIQQAGEAVILNGPYATQAIAPPASEAPFSGAIKNDSGAGLMLVQEQDTGLWRALTPNLDLSDLNWNTFDEYTLLSAFRAYAKGYGEEYNPDANFDDLDGGNEISGDVIQLVDVPADKQKALEDLILRHKPLHSWAAMVVRYT